MEIVKMFVDLSQNLLFIALGMIGIGLLIAIHEFGHFVFCKIFHIGTPSFSIGFGPRLWQKKIGNTVFALSSIPLGGYVEIAGSAEMGQGEQQDAQSTAPDSFAVKPYYQKLLVMLGGIFFNLIFAYLVFVFIFFMGTPSSEVLAPILANTKPVIKNIVKDSAAEKYHLDLEDTILSVDGISIENSTEKLSSMIKPKAKKQITLLIERNGEKQELPFIPDEITILGESIGSLGVFFHTTELPGLPFIAALKKGVKKTNDLIMLTLKAFKHIFAKRDVSQMAGPVTLISTTIKGAGMGLTVFFIFLAILSVNLAVLNIIPLPILDGGQVLFYTIEAIIRRQIPLKIKEYIHLTSWLLILLLTLYLSYKDISRLVLSYKDQIAHLFSSK